MYFNRIISRLTNSIFKARNLNDIPYHGYIRSFNTGKVKQTSTLKLSLIGASIGTLVGTGYSLKKINETNSLTHEEITIPKIDTVPAVKPSRKVCCIITFSRI